MNVGDVVQGFARDRIRTALLAGLRLRGDLMGQIFDSTVRDDPYPMYRRLREMGPVVRTTMGPLTTHHAVCDGVLRHPSVLTATTMRDEIAGGGQRFQRWLFGTPNRGALIEPIGPESMIGMNAPEHTRMRKLVSKAFTRRAVEELRPRLTRIADDLVHQVRSEPSFDLMSEVAGVFPVSVICELLAIPEPDHQQFRRWGSALAADLDTLTPAPKEREATNALRALQDYFTDLFDQRRRDPGDDLLSELIMVEEAGDRLTSRELLATCTLLLFAGFETTVNLIGNGVAALLDHRDQLDQLRSDHGLIPAAVDELLRYDTSIQLTSRVPSEDIEVEGVQLRAGEPVSVMIGGANRDPAVFDDPESLDIDRHNARRHLSFAAGPHHCLGASLARLEGEIMITALLDQLGDLRPAGEAPRRPTFVLRGYESLPLRGNPTPVR
ncbi:cytochrome P450 [Microlunatus soli]|uniref:Cytochrome P450 n=1 Tax=Microlunatus soli TaxID=630515 RepID=A0A1H2ACM8_9ACTN|nr:cytochrome P450 [Microlunatus soli]SDT43721.1 hypothetical protein SAMN04489812_5836 [Microlunatus soli]